MDTKRAGTTKNAIILAAGQGTRLLPITKEIPKPLVEVNGISILERCLDNLAVCGIKNVTIVVGYLGNLIQNRIGDNYNGLSIAYVINPAYAKAGNAYSLYLGLQAVADDTFMIEGDILFDKKILATKRPNQISWFADSKNKVYDGTYLTVDVFGVINSLEIIRDLSKIKINQWKSAGMLYIPEVFIGQMQRWFEDAFKADRYNDWYERVLSDHLGSKSIHAIDVNLLKWCEVDTEHDLERALELF
jgi:choline kinase